MCNLNFYFDMPDAAEDAWVRLWLDDSRAQDLHSEVELPLVRTDNRWTGRYQGEGLDADACFWLRATICGTPGSTWHIEVCEEGDTAPLLVDGDELVMGRELLVTTCQRGAASA